MGRLFSKLDTNDIADDFASPTKPSHNGIDIGANQGIFLNDVILAPENLVGVQVGFSSSNGNYLSGTSEDGKRKYIFLHQSELPAKGDRKKGFVIGKVGNTGHVINNNVHLHLSVVTTDQEINRLGLKSLPAYAGWGYVSFKELAQKLG